MLHRIKLINEGSEFRRRVASREAPPLPWLLLMVICNHTNDQCINTCFLIICIKMTHSLGSCVTKAVFVCRASCQCTLALLQSGTGWGGGVAGLVTEGLILALGESSLPVKSSSDTTRTIQARNCPLDFPLKLS